MTEPKGDAQAIIEAMREVDAALDLAPAMVYLVTDRDGSQRVIDTDAYAGRPRRTERTVTLQDAASLVSYLRHHADPDDGPEVWADQPGSKVRAILDPPQGAEPAWCRHLAILQLRNTPEWTLWVGASGRLVGQQEFAEFIEDRVADIITPSGAEMLELAQSFHATNKVAFESSSFLASGQRGLEYREQVEAKAGRTGQIVIPATFELALRPYEGCDPYKVIARLRYRISDGGLRIGYKLVDPDAVLRAAFGDVVGTVQEGLLLDWQPIRWGAPTP